MRMSDWSSDVCSSDLLGLGQSTAVGIGGDPINGLKHIDVLQMFNDDPDTDADVMIGEIGGPDEVNAAEWAIDNMKKPVVDRKSVVAGTSVLRVDLFGLRNITKKQCQTVLIVLI